jgi:hypothetical protein
VNRLRPLLPEKVSFSSVFPSERCNGTVKAMGVSYTTRAHGMPVAGRVFVDVAAGGEAFGVMGGLHPTVVAGHPLPILSPREAVGRLLDGRAQVVDGPSWNAMAYIDSVKLTYWQPPPALPYPYLVPIYVLKGEAVAEGRKAQRWMARVVAVRPEYLGAVYVPPE